MYRKKYFVDTSLLKDRSYVELAYMTGILPIAKHSSRSPLNMFKEYSALKDDTFDKYFGFTHSEVEHLCAMQDKVSLPELEDWYNDENSLACVIQLAYISALKRYEISREKKAGDGIVDFAFIPYKKSDPAFIMELKVDKNPEKAVKQMQNKNYTQALINCTGHKLAIVVAYNKDNSNKDDNRRHYINIQELT